MKTEMAVIAPLVEAEMQRILASPQFASSDRLQRFLRYIVAATLEGNTDHLKESVIGVQVFDLAIGFDPKLDPVVRVTARRLRDKLDQFYSETPSPSGQWTTVSKGSAASPTAPRSWLIISGASACDGAPTPWCSCTSRVLPTVGSTVSVSLEVPVVIGAHGASAQAPTPITRDDARATER